MRAQWGLSSGLAIVRDGRLCIWLNCRNDALSFVVFCDAEYNSTTQQDVAHFEVFPE